MKDQELDRLLQQVARDAMLDDQAVDEIAESPTLLWNVQREIRNADTAKAPWPPNILRRLLIVGVPVATAIVIGLGVYFGTISSRTPELAEAPQTTVQPDLNGPSQPVASRAINPDKTADKATIAARRTVEIFRASSQRTRTARVPAVAAAKDGTSAEIKSGFVALAYAQDPESGQLVRVKVPSSMMVSLGVVPTVSDPSKLIDAEVLVGDDGLTHSIRFIRQ